ncbi:pumilio homolog 23 isoform X2 [Trifolium pratense]|uniref:pumilio homolog 23 isoform X2 n=1 Tax=Trifolium pratense TaxID=57577 RepID=UPI001E698347|nr:pumilio homolog 23 isoform X2 [Trifolium pratense]XP_045794819.1 pumilio homolog 23 isoform X2 [Trifolium pratense]XP_045794820.1 pumilio homolog 23 isoform X2 [Trifolium pratense]XP_045794821.1 pumilio homolog 23 isoform X2 [Trifolium pratense]XP_045794822.1 pumilio homolog 23 isoform X2 [Trifolium pratense]XP_045794823.1 pumilio homolog 23 isoform X2 [Trifolium pratense]
MVSVGSKALPSRSCSTGRGSAAATKSKKPKKGSTGDDAAAFDDTHTHHRNTFSSAPHQQQSRIRKQVDPETTKYLSEIANLFESDSVELEERSLICANALEETKGKEFEIATDYILSHTLETILQGCDVDNLCSFLQSSAKQFPFIAMDRSGSHVAQTAINSLAYHLQHDDVRPLVEEALTVICKVIAANSVDVMCNCYGSHVLRTLICLCKGVPLDKSGFYLSKCTTALAERLNFKHFSSNKDDFQHGFPNLLNLLVSDIFNHATKYIKFLQLDQFSSLVFQTTLRVLAGNDEMLLDVIPILLGCKNKNNAKGNFIEGTVVPDLKNLLKEPGFSRLMEVVLEVSPLALFNELFTKVFRNSLFELSSHQHGNFVVQALISHASDQDLMELIWDELGPNMESLFQMGRSGVVASLIAACERLHVNEHKCCQVLAKTVSLADESSKWIVPRLLFLDSYFTFEDKSNWIWQSGAKMNVMGSLILQTIFRFNSEHIKPYVTSITSMDTTHVLQTVRDARGSHVIEAFLCSGAPGKHKRRLVTKLQRHFGEVALHSSGAFTIEKCFTACNLSLRETIVSELLAVQSELSKTKQGSYLLRKLDIDGYAASPDHWRSKQASKESTYKEFYATFGSNDTRSMKNDGFLADTSNNKSNPNNVKEMRKEIDQSLGSSSFLSMDGFNRNPKKAKQKNKKNAEIGVNEDDSSRKKKRSKKEKVESGHDIAAAAEVARKNAKKRQRNRDISEASGKKLKTSDE